MNSSVAQEKNREIDSINQAISHQDQDEKVKSLLELSKIYRNIAWEKAVLYADSANNLARILENDYLVSLAEFQLGRLYSSFGQIDEAIVHLKSALNKLDKESEEKLFTSILSTLGIAYAKGEVFDTALIYLNQAYELKVKQADSIGIGVINNALGNIYYFMDEFMQALKYYQKANVIYRKLNDSVNLSINLNNIGSIYEELGDKSNAHDHFIEAENIARAVNCLSCLNLALNNLGVFYFDLEDFEKAQSYYEEALTISEELNRRYQQTILLNNLALIYKNEGDLNKAITYLKEGLKLAVDGDYAHMKSEIYFNLSGIYFKLGQNETAYQYLLDYSTLNDSLNQIESREKLAELQAKYEKDYVERENAALKQKEELQEARLRFQAQMIILISVVALVVIVFIYRNFRQKNKVSKILAAKNSEIEKQKDLAEKALRDYEESQEQNITILDSIPDLYFIVEKDGTFIGYHSKSTEDLILPPEEFLNRKMTDVLPKELADKGMQYIKAASVTGKIQQFIQELELNKAKKIFDYRIVPTRDKKFLILVRDMTEQFRLEEELKFAKEEAEKADEMKSMFLASLSHEIRTPMSSIIGITSVLEETELTEEQREYINIINISGNNLLSLINNILDFSKIESDQIELESILFDIRELVDEVVALLKLKADDTGNNIITEISDDFPGKLIGDPVRMRQILINLVNNALKFTKDGTVTIRINLFDEDEEKIRLKFNIIDTGVGVAIDQRDKLFRAFSQADESIARKYGGTGLGLAISKLFTTMMGGEIGVESKPGKGSNFWFTIVFKKSPDIKIEPQEVLPPTEPESKEIPEKALRILLVEDNILNQKFAMAILKKYNHVVDIAENGQIGVDLFKENDYDVVLMDIQMPVMDGLEATEEIRKIEKESGSGHIRIVAVTAYAMEGDEDRFYEAGIDDYLRKPYKAGDLIGKLKNPG